MSRTSAQQAVNNFTGGLVTEASPLKFPQNSLSKAMNVECTITGDLRARGAFTRSNVILSAGPSYGLREVKKFFWKENKSQVLVYIYDGYYQFVVLKEGNSFSSGVFSLPSGYALTNSKYLNVSFNNGIMYFPINYAKGSDTFSAVVSATIKPDSTIEFSDFFKVEELIIPSGREPSVGSTNLYTPSTNQLFWPDRYKTLMFVVEYTHPTDPAGTFSELSMYWGKDTADRYDYTWGETQSFTPAAVPTSPISLGGYSYYVDFSNFDTLYDEPSKPSSIQAIRVRAYGVYRNTSESLSTITKGSQPLTYRDFKGLPNHSSLSYSYITPNDERVRDTNYFSAYNLYNAGWGPAGGRHMVVADETGTTLASASPSFAQKTRDIAEVYPSLADSQYDYLTEEASDIKAIGLYSPYLLSRNKPYSSSARRGSHILGLGLESNPLATREGQLAYFPPSFLLAGRTTYRNEFNQKAAEQAGPSSITASEIIGGRMWYGVSGRDFNVMFSQIDFDNSGISGSSLGNLSTCYQRNDPNSEILNTVLPTDGGTITLKDVGTVYSFKSFRQYVLVFSDKGVWALSGVGGDSFTPVSYSVTKISDKGVTGPGATLSTEEVVYYLTTDSLNVISVNENNNIFSQDLSSEKILKTARSHISNFNISANKKLVWDSENRRVLIDYSNSLTGPFTQSIFLGNILGNSSLVYDSRLGCFYRWSTSLFSRLSAFGVSAVYPEKGELPDFSSTDDYTAQSLGFLEFGNSFVLLKASTVATIGPTNGETIWKLPPSGGDLYRLQQTAVGTSGVHLVDSQTSFTNVKPACWYRVEAEIPYDILGDPTLDKSVRTMTVFQEMSTETVVGTGTTLSLPEVELGWEWEWDSKRSGNTTLTNNIQYPEHINYASKQVGISKVKVPGRGKSLTLSFSPAENSSVGFCILGYGIDFDASNRP